MHPIHKENRKYDFSISRELPGFISLILSSLDNAGIHYLTEWTEANIIIKFPYPVSPFDLKLDYASRTMHTAFHQDTKIWQERQRRNGRI